MTETTEKRDNMRYYSEARQVPKSARSPIPGRYGGKNTAINAMWRIKKLTELFGPAGIGWYTKEKIKKNTLTNGEEGYTARVKLYVRGENGEWSKPIAGFGGAPCLDRRGRYDDDAEKKAATDAFGNACKKLGIGADVYFELDAQDDKYAPMPQDSSPEWNVKKYVSPNMVRQIEEKAREVGKSLSAILTAYSVERLSDLTADEANIVMRTLVTYEKRANNADLSA